MGFLNPNTLKKYTALFLCCFIPVIAFVVTLSARGLIIPLNIMFICLGSFFGASVLSIFIGTMFLKNPFSALMEGEGLLTWVLDSTGVIRPFIMKLKKPDMIGDIDGKEVKDIFDREGCGFSIAPPIDNNPKDDIFSRIKNKILAKKEAQKKAENKAEITPDINGNLKFNIQYTLSANDVNTARFALGNFVCFLYNQQTQGFLTKDFLAAKESNLFAKHLLLVTNKRIEELVGCLRDFGRYVVEQTKPKGESWFNGKMGLIIIVIALVVIGLLFGKPLYQAITGAYHSTAPMITQSINTASESVPLVVPK